MSAPGFPKTPPSGINLNVLGVYQDKEGRPLARFGEGFEIKDTNGITRVDVAKLQRRQMSMQNQESSVKNASSLKKLGHLMAAYLKGSAVVTVLAPFIACKFVQAATLPMVIIGAAFAGFAYAEMKDTLKKNVKDYTLDDILSLAIGGLLAAIATPFLVVGLGGTAISEGLSKPGMMCIESMHDSFCKANGKTKHTPLYRDLYTIYKDRNAKAAVDKLPKNTPVEQVKIIQPQIKPPGTKA